MLITWFSIVLFLGCLYTFVCEVLCVLVAYVDLCKVRTDALDVLHFDAADVRRKFTSELKYTIGAGLALVLSVYVLLLDAAPGLLPHPFDL